MRPVRLTLHAFGPFPGEVDVDFERLAQHGLFLIHGPTGAGKSTLLDAMTYALFGDAAGGPERSGSSFASSLAPLARSEVLLEFDVGGTHYRVQRSPKQLVARARGASEDAAPVQRQSEARLERIDTSGAVLEVVADKTSETNRAVEALLGIGVKQFRQTVVLPQGAFREVVTDEKAREQVLKQLFSTERFAALTAQLRAITTERAQAGEAQRRARDHVLRQAGVTDRRELQARQHSAAEALRAANGEREACEQARRASATALHEGERTLERFERLDALTERLATLQANATEIEQERQRLAAAQRAERVVSSDERRQYAQRSLLEALQAHEAGVASERSAAERHQRAVTVLERERARAEERSSARTLVQQLSALEADVNALAAQRQAVATHQGNLDRYRADASSAATEVEALSAQRDALRAERDTLREQVAQLDSVRRDHDEAQQRFSARTEIERIAEQLDASSDLEAATTAEDASLLELLRSHAAGMVSERLSEGEPCPVCGSLHHPAPHAVTDSAAFADALERYRAQEAARQERHTARSLLLAERDSLVQRWGWGESLPDVAATENAANEARAALAAMATANQQLHVHERDLERAVAALEVGTQRLHRAQLGVERETAEVRALERDIARTLTKLPDDATDPALFAERLAGARAHADALEQALRDATEAEADARGALAAANASMHERNLYLERARQEDAASADAFVEALTTEAFADEAAYRAARLDEQTLSALRERVREHDEALRSARAQHDEFATGLAGVARPDREALGAALAAAEQAWQAADAALQVAQQAHDALARHAEAFDAAESAYRELEASLAAATRLSKLAAGTVAGRVRVDLETFVLQRQFHEVLQVGNAHLRAITQGRYSLHLVRDAQRASGNGLDLEVADHFVDGVRRPAKTLSGGEGFLAALALALGLSDIAQRARHPIEALFIDEGFGSLDRSTLDQVTRMLRTLPQTAGRMIGIISHVEELKRLLPVQLVVRASARGSELAITINE